MRRRATAVVVGRRAPRRGVLRRRRHARRRGRPAVRHRPVRGPTAATAPPETATRGDRATGDRAALRATRRGRQARRRAGHRHRRRPGNALELRGHETGTPSAAGDGRRVRVAGCSGVSSGEVVRSSTDRGSARPVTGARPRRHPRPRSTPSSGSRRRASATSRRATARRSRANVVLPGPVEDGPYPTVVEYSGYTPSDPDAQGSRICSRRSATPTSASTCAAPGAAAVVPLLRVRPEPRRLRRDRERSPPSRGCREHGSAWSACRTRASASCSSPRPSRRAWRRSPRSA